LKKKGAKQKREGPIDVRENVLYRVQNDFSLTIPKESHLDILLEPGGDEKELKEIIGQESFDKFHTYNGKVTLTEIAQALFFAPYIRDAEQAYHMHPKDLWKHSVAVALIAKEMSLIGGSEVPPHTYLSGLLHDIGKVLLGPYVEIEKEIFTGMALREQITVDIAEKHSLGIDHAEAGSILLSKWGLPPEIVHTVRWHHQPDKFKYHDLRLDLVHIANAITYVVRIGFDQGKLEICPSCLAIDRLNITTGDAEKVVEICRDKMRDLAFLL